jgi:hypothetical protein
VVHFSGAMLSMGVEEHRLEGAAVRVYCPEKTVVDCFRFRNKVGLDVALEALLEVLQTRRNATDSLWHYASACRMANVMRPYLEAMACLG